MPEEEVTPVLTELEKVKIASEMFSSDEDFDKTLKFKISVVKGFLKKAGATDENLATDEGIQCIAIGVNDILNISNSEVKFSPVFMLFAIQLRG